jgi:serine protease Do
MRIISALAISLIAAGVLISPAVRAQTARGSRAVVISRSGSYLGIGGIDIDEERAKALNLKEVRGVEIKSVDANSPASKAGLKDGDVVLEYNGQPVAGIEQFARLVRETPAGREVRLQVWRGGAMQTITATIATRPGATIHGDGDTFSFTMPPMPPIPPVDLPTTHTTWRSPSLGVETESLTPQLAEFFGVKEGVLVRAVTRNSAAEKAGLKAGDIVIRLDETKVSSPREITSALHALRAKRTFPVVVVRNHQEMTFSVTLEERRGMRELRPNRARAIHC